MWLFRPLRERLTNPKVANTKKTILISIIALFGTAITFAQSPNYQGIIYVTPTGAGTHSGDSWANATSSIAQAQTLAQTHNADVWVAEGIYYGDTTMDNAFTMVEGVDVYGGFAGNEPLNFNLAMRDFQNHESILDGQNSQRVLQQSSDFNLLTVWDGFTIQNGRTITKNVGGMWYIAQGGGASISNNGCLRNCIITHNKCDNPTSQTGYFTDAGGAGVFMYEGSIISNCLIVNNSSHYFGGGVNGTGTIYNSTIARNSAGIGGAGVFGGDDTPITLINCIIWGNKGSLNVEGSVTCSYSAIENGFIGDHNILLSDEGMSQPLFVQPSLIAGAYDTSSLTDWHLQNGSICINRGNNTNVIDSVDMDGEARIQHDTVDLGCYETPYNSTPWQPASYSGVVYVTSTGAGTHSGDSWSNATSSISYATAVAHMNNASVWVAAGTYYGDTLSSNAFLAVKGVNVYGGFAGNEPSNFNLSQRNFEAYPTILDGQNARRVLYGFRPYSVWDGFTITHGNANDIETVDQGAGGGVFFQFNGTLRHCTITHNYGMSGGGVYLNQKNRIENCLVSNNSSTDRGGGICAYYYDTIVNTTVTKNYTDGDGGGIYVCGGPTLITNCVIWGNEHTDVINRNIVPDNIYQCGGQSISCSYSAIEGGFQGNYNIPLFDGTPLQPFFVHPSASSGKDDTTSNVNWHIQEGSICINRGDNSAVTDSMDLSGLDRNLRDTVDIGCYETYYYRSHVLFNEESLVNCDSCVWNGATYYESGNYTHTETDANGYDNVGILHLTLNHSTDTEETVESINNYTWNGNVYTQSGDYTWVGIGENGCDSVVTLHLTITVGVDYYDGLDFKVYPNPTSNIVNVECIMKNEEWGEVELHLCDAYGRLLDVARANNHSPLQTAQIDLSRYATGVYFIKAVADGKTIAVRKVVRN